MDQLVGFLSGGSQLDGELNLPKVLGDLGTKTITENGTYDASDDGLDGYSEVTVNVSEDNTLVVTLYKDNNDEWYPTLTFAEILAAYTAGRTIAVEADGNSEVVSADGEMKVDGGSTYFEYWVRRYVPNSSPIELVEQGYKMYSAGTDLDEEQIYIEPTGTKSITANGTNIDVKNYSKVDVAVPNSYSAGDEGKVVDNGALVSQTAHADVTPTTSDQTIDTTTNNSIKVKGDADLVASNIKKDVEIFGVTGSYEGGGGGGLSLDDFFNRTAPVGAASLPTVTKLYGRSFYNNAVMTSINAPNITRLGAYDFGYCNGLVDVSMPELLYACINEKGDAAINNNDSCHAFEYCYNLGTVHLPKFLKSGNGLFYYVGHNKSNYNCIIVLPSVTQFGHSACRGGSFKAVDLGTDLTALNNDTFYQATVDVLILRSSTLVSAGNRDAVRNVKNLYVPSALVSSYATASNWASDAASRTVTAIEGSQYENYYADGTPVT